MIKMEGISMQFIRVTRLPTTVRRGLEVVFVLNGELTIQLDQKIYSLSPDQMVIFDGLLPCTYFSEHSNAIVLCRISESFLRSQCEELTGGHVFYVSGETPVSDIGFTLKRLFSQMIFQYIRGVKIEFQAFLFQFLCQLYKNCYTTFPTEKNDNLSDSLPNEFRQLLDYVATNYQRRISLSDAAARVYMSAPAFSRYFKAKMGVNFSEYLSHIRVEHAAEELLTTKHTVSYVASINGFSNEKAFTQIFRRFYEMTPGNYRKSMSVTQKDILLNQKYKDEVLYKNTDFSFDEIQDFMNLMYRGTGFSAGRFIDTKKENPVSVTCSSEYNAFNFYRIITVDQGIASVFHSDIREQLEIVQRTLHFDYVNIGDFDLKILEKNTSVIEQGDFAYGDRFILDALNAYQAMGFSLYIQVDFSLLMKNYPEGIELFYERFSHFMRLLLKLDLSFYKKPVCLELRCSEKKYYKDFSEFCHRIMEIGNSFYLVDIKRLKIKIGLGLLPWMISEIEEQDIAELTSLSFSFLGVEWRPFQNCVLSGHEWSENMLDIQTKFFQEQFDILKQKLALFRLGHSSLYITRWNVLAGVDTAEIGTFFRSSIILDALIRFDGRIGGITFPCRTMQSSGHHANELALFYIKAVKRPVFFVLHIIKQLSCPIIFRSSQVMVVKRPEGGYTAALFSPIYINPTLSLDRFFVEQETIEVRLCLQNLDNGIYRIKRLNYDKTSSGVYERSVEIGIQDFTDPDFIDRLETIIQPGLFLYQEKVTAHKLELSAVLSFNSITLYHIVPIY